MRCPVCEHFLEETAAACPGCGFSLPLADAHYGACPQAAARVSDHAGHLSRVARADLMKAGLEFEQRFPGLRLTVLVHELPPGVPGRPYLFWMFNRCGLHTAIEKGGANRHVLLWIDPAHHRASAMVGYGLEPLVSEEMLSQALEAAVMPMTAGQWAQAGLAFISALDTALADLQSRLPAIFGWFPEETWTALEDDFDPIEKGLSSTAVAY